MYVIIPSHNFYKLIRGSYIATSFEPYIVTAATDTLLESSPFPPVLHKPGYLAPGPTYYDTDRSDSASRTESSMAPLIPVRSPMFQHSLSPSLLPTSHLNHDTPSLTGVGVADSVFRSRMQRLQDLVLELNREIAQGSGDESPLVLELRGRIAELTRGDSALARRNTTATIPPPYEARRD